MSFRDYNTIHRNFLPVPKLQCARPEKRDERTFFVAGFLLLSATATAAAEPARYHMPTTGNIIVATRSNMVAMARYKATRNAVMPAVSYPVPGDKTADDSVQDIVNHDRFSPDGNG